MSFADCVQSAVQAGRITREQAEDLFQRQQDATQQFRLDPQHSPESAARMADELGLERAKQDVRLRKYQAALQAIKNSENMRRVLDFEKGPTEGVRTLIARDSNGRATWSSVEAEARNILNQAHAPLAEGISKIRTRWLGLHQDKKLLREAVTEMFGESTGNATARSLAKTWAEVAEGLRMRFNRAGGAIPKRADWGLPQSHDAVKVGRVSVSEWVDFVKDNIDIERMVDVETGQPFTPDSLDIVLQGVHETIRSNGVSDMVPGAQGGKKMGNRRQEARFLVFKNSESWLRYQERFGEPNIFSTMQNHLAGMSRDIALMEVLGPNPSAGFRMMQDVAAKAEQQPLKRATNQRIFNVINGTGDPNKSPFMANVLGAIRSWNVASMLGSAAISAVSDLEFIQLTTRWNGLSGSRAMRFYVEQLNPKNEADRILATRVGIGALSYANQYSNVGRFTEIEGAGGGIVGKIANAGNIMAELTLRASGLNAMTDAGRRGFAMEFSATLAESFGKRLDDIDGNLGRTLRERGMTADEWDLIRQTPTTDHKGAKFFTVDQLMDRTDIPLSKRQQLASRVQTMMNEEMIHAVPEPDALVRQITTGGESSGTIAGTLMRSVTQFKSFPLAVLSLHVQRARYARQLRGNMPAAGYAAHAIIGTTLFGMLAMQMKLISKGQDPRDMDDSKAWAAAFIQGGGAGIYGDFLFADANRFGGGAVSTLSGPSMGLAEDMIKVSWGNVQQLMSGEEPKLAADVVGFAKRYMPGGSLWYTRLVLEREVWDQLSEAADPGGFRRRVRRQERRARDQGTQYWWRPGERAPERAPDLGAE